MATEYRLTLAGETTVEQVVERALPEPAERPTGTPPLLSADLYDRYGFGIAVRAGRDGYVDVESDNGQWQWEPKSYVAVTFRMEKNVETDRATANMLTVVRRLLSTGSEDAVFVLDGDVLLFTRFGGELVKHRRPGWWASYPVADELIPG